MGHQPTCDEIVVVGIELVSAPPILVREARHEGLILQDAGSICGRPARQAGDAPIDVGRRRDLEVPPLEIEGSQEIPHVGLVRPAQALTRPHASHVGFLEGCEQPMEHVGRPCHVVIRQDGDDGGDLRDGSAQLMPLVGVCHGEDAEVGRLRASDQFGQALTIRLDGDEQDLAGLGEGDGPDGLPQLGAIGIDGRDDDGDVVTAQGRFPRGNDGLEGPMRETMHDETQVTVEPVPERPLA